jgi:hypothetical protein
VLTRNTDSERAKNIAKLPNVTLIQGSQDNQKDLHKAFHGVWGAWVNTDGFTIGEKNELFYGIRAYEIARHEGVQHYVYASTDYAVKDANWNEKYHWGHNDAKGRVGEFILAQGQKGMTSSLLITGPYMNMLYDGMFVPQQQDDGSFVWANPASKFPYLSPLTDVVTDRLFPQRGWQGPSHSSRRRRHLLSLDVRQNHRLRWSSSESGHRRSYLRRDRSNIHPGHRQESLAQIRAFGGVPAHGRAFSQCACELGCRTRYTERRIVYDVARELWRVVVVLG